MFSLKSLPVLVLAIAAALPALAQAGAQYSVTRLGPVGFDTAGVSINNSGTVAGSYFSMFDNARRGFVWSNGVLKDFTDTGTYAQYATDINEHGAVSLVAGDLDISFGQAYRYENGVYTPLGRLKPGASARALGLNNNGAVVGDSGIGQDTWSSNALRHAFIYKDGKLTDLGTLGGSQSVGFSVNDAGAAVGAADLADGSRHAFLYQNGGMVDLGTLGGANSIALSINNLGSIVGGSGSGNSQQAFLYENGVMKALGWTGVATDINEHGQVVGSASDDKAYLYSGGAAVDLNTLIDSSTGLTLTEANGINDRGQIVGQGCDAFGDCVGVLLSPVPEPTTYAMLLAGLGLLGYTARRRAGN